MAQLSNKEWLSNLKVGEPVYIDETLNLGGKKRIAQVARLTKTQIIVGSTKFRRDDGRQIGVGPYFRTRIEFPTPEYIYEVRKQTLVIRLKNVPWENHSIEFLERVWKEIETGLD